MPEREPAESFRFPCQFLPGGGGQKNRKNSQSEEKESGWPENTLEGQVGAAHSCCDWGFSRENQTCRNANHCLCVGWTMRGGLCCSLCWLRVAAAATTAVAYHHYLPPGVRAARTVPFCQQASPGGSCCRLHLARSCCVFAQPSAAHADLGSDCLLCWSQGVVHQVDGIRAEVVKVFTVGTWVKVRGAKSLCSDSNTVFKCSSQTFFLMSKTVDTIFFFQLWNNLSQRYLADPPSLHFTQRQLWLIFSRWIAFGICVFYNDQITSVIFQGKEFKGQLIVLYISPYSK